MFASYIVVYNKDVTADVIASHVENVNALVSKRDTSAGIEATYEISDFKGYAIATDLETINAIAASPEVLGSKPIFSPYSYHL